MSTYFSIRQDEDHHQVYTFTDKLGRTVLRREMGDTAHDTYYIYDDIGNLRYVLPPAASEVMATSGSGYYTLDNETVKDFAYYYEYDVHNNCVKKKLPGCEPIIMKYDKMGRLVFSQDGNQRQSGIWAVSLYDAFGRTAITGIWNSPSIPIIGGTNTTVSYTGTGRLAGYSTDFYSDNDSISLHTVNYYDNYHFLGRLPAVTQNKMIMRAMAGYDDAYPSNSEPNAKGLLTGTMVYQFGEVFPPYLVSSNFNTASGNLPSSVSLPGIFPIVGPGPVFVSTNPNTISAFYYDDSGKIVQSHSSNNMGGYDSDYYCYSYTGNVLQHKHNHSASGSAYHSEVYSYEYDHADRLVRTMHTLDDGVPFTIAQNTYDEVGRLTTKSIPVDETAYTYNIRGWITGINSSLFNEHLYYNHIHNSSTPQFGGNISAVDWNMGDNTAGYAYRYDSLSRLRQADYYENGIPSFKFDSRYSYDRMGNILSLERNGLLDDDEYGAIDDITLTYSGNQLIKADDSAEGPYYAGASHFVDNADSEIEYTYDENGNMTKDLNRNILSIEYNSLNLPKQIAYLDGSRVYYTYDATGNKLRTEYYVRSMNGFRLERLSTRDYCGNYIYENGSLSQILFDGGYITVSDTTSEYHYYIQDHLGNNRVVAKERGIAEQVNHYYPFGMLMGTSTNGDIQRYKYNGKELDRMNGLDWMDYGARNYNGLRFTTVDPLAHKYYNVSPYAYCMNNPVKFIDPDGRTIYLSGSYEENKQLINILQQLTNDRIGFIAKTGEVVIMKNGRGKANEGKGYNLGTALVRELISSDKTMKLQTNNEKIWKCTDTYTEDKNKGNSYNGVGSDVTINVDLSIELKFLVQSQNTSISTWEVAPNFVSLGHELIHGYRSMNGIAIRGNIYDEYEYRETDGYLYRMLRQKKEETETVGIRKPQQCDFTENKLRREHNIKSRIRY